MRKDLLFGICKIMVPEQHKTDLIALADALPYGVLIAHADGTSIYANAAWNAFDATRVVGASTGANPSLLSSFLHQYGHAEIATDLEQLRAGTISQLTLRHREPASSHASVLKLTRLSVHKQVYLIVQQLRDEAGAALPVAAPADSRERLLQLAQAITTTLSLDTLLLQVHHALFPVIAYDVMALFQLDPDTQRFRMVSRVEPGGHYFYPDDWSVPFGTGVLMLVYQSDAGLLINDAQHHPNAAYPYNRPPPVNHFLGVPLFDHGERIGVFLIERYAPPSFTQEDYDLFTWFARQAEPAIANASLFTRVQQRARELDLLRRAQLELASAVGLEATLRRAVEVVHQVLGYPRVGLHLVNEQRTQIILQHQIGYPQPAFCMPIWRGIIGRAIASGTPELVREVRRDPDFVGDRQTGSELAIPLFDNDQVIGALNVETEPETFLNEDDRSLLVLFASYVSQAIVRARLYSALREREQRFQALIAHTDEVIFILDEQGAIQYVSPAVERVLGYTADELLGQPFLSYLLPEADSPLPQAHEIASWTGGEYRMLHHSQQVRELELHVSNLLHTPTVNGIVINCHDVTRLKQAARQMRHQALYDALTGLPNRAYLMDQLEQLFKRIGHRGNGDVALLFIDLDDFKLINDTLGHLIGDEFLKQIATRLRDELPSDALVARLGGDEFTVVLPQVQHSDEAVASAELVQASLDRPLHISGFELRARASIGVALHPATFESPIDLLRAADTAMYRAKKTGKNQVAVFDTSMYNEVAGQLRMQLDLPHAIAHHELELEYHPIVALASGRVEGMRAELYWHHPQLGRMPYQEFAEAAESIRFVPVILQWALSEAFYHLRLWLDAANGVEPPRLHLALQHAYFRDPDMCRSIAAIAQTTGVPLHYMVADVSSSAILAGDNETRVSLSCLVRHNMGLSVVGPGLQEALVSLPEDIQPVYVGIPVLVTDMLESDPRARVIVSSIVQMAHSLEMLVQARDIVTAAQANLLREAGCDYASGPFFSRPLPGLAVAAVLRRGTHMLVVGEPEHVRVLESADD